MFAVLQSLGTGPASEMLALQYADDATRLQTAIGNALDIAAVDFFGVSPVAPVAGLSGTQLTPVDSGFRTDVYALPRVSKETDAAYSARLLAAMMPLGATRAAVISAVTKASGFPPVRIVEPWSPADTGVWSQPTGQPMAFWGVDTPANPFRWTNPGLAYQGFIDSVLPGEQPFGNNPTPVYDNSGLPFFWGVPTQGLYYIDPQPSAPRGSQVLYNAVIAVKVEGTIVWVKFVPPPVGPTWDHPGTSWDQSGVVWQ